MPFVAAMRWPVIMALLQARISPFAIELFIIATCLCIAHLAGPGCMLVTIAFIFIGPSPAQVIILAAEAGPAASMAAAMAAAKISFIV